jgi:ATP-dependent Lon protease
VSARLPLFPLPVVLFPGVSLPLHIFEPRYRQMLADCLSGDRRFGMLYRPDDLAELELPPGHVGCLARIMTAEQLPDGRSNIIVTGAERFALLRFVESEQPYHVGDVEPYDDEPGESEAALADVGTRVRTLFDRVGRAARTLADDADPLPTLPDDDTMLSFAIASMIDLDGPTRQEILASRSALERLRRINDVLERAAEPIEHRASVHARAKSNGRGPHAA